MSFSSLAKSTRGGNPLKPAPDTCCQIDPPNSSNVWPSKYSSSMPETVPNLLRTLSRTSSITPNTPTTGVGKIASEPVWL